jgi:hypothetical protein
MFIAAPLTIAKERKLPKYTNWWIKRIYTTEYYSTIKK